MLRTLWGPAHVVEVDERDVCQLCANRRPALSPDLTTRYQGGSPRSPPRLEPHMHRAVALLLFAVLAAAAPLAVPAARGASPDLVVSQVFAGGGNAGAPFANDFVELFNRGSTAVDVSGWTVQYASATGTTWQATALTGSIAARPPLPRPARLRRGGRRRAAGPGRDRHDEPRRLGRQGRVVALDAALACGATAGSCSAVASVADLVGYGTAIGLRGWRARRRRSTTRPPPSRGGGRMHRHRCQPSRLRVRGADAAQLVEPRRSHVRHRAAAQRAASRRARRSTSTSSRCSRSRSSARASASATRRPAARRAPVSERVTVVSNNAAGYARDRPPHGLPARRPAARRRRHRSERRADRSAARRRRDGRDPDRACRRPARRARRGAGAPPAGDVWDTRLGFVVAASRRPGRAIHGDGHVHGDRSMRRATAPRAGRARARARLGGRGHDPAAARAHGDAGAHRARRAAGQASVRVTNPGSSPSSSTRHAAGFSLDLRGRPRVVHGRRAARRPRG